MTTQTEAERLAQWLLDNYEADEIDLAANLLRKQRADIEKLERLLKTSANSERQQVSFNQQLMDEVARLKALAEQPAPAPVGTVDDVLDEYIIEHRGLDRNALVYLAQPPAQPEREWVNLTVDELIDLEHKHLRHEALAQAIEAKLKEKNT